MTQTIRIALCSALLACLLSESKAQYIFEMMNGRQLEVFHFNDSAFIDIRFTYDKNSLRNQRIRQYNENLRYEIADRKGDQLTRAELDALVEKNKKSLRPEKKKETYVSRDDVFAIIDSDGNRQILYEYQPEYGNDYTVREMEEFMLGQRDAMLNYKAPLAFWGGAAFGLLGGLAWQNSIFAVSTPVVWTLFTAIPPIHIKERYMHDPNMKTDAYRAGFARNARSRQLIQGLKGSVIGTAAGVLLYSVLANNVEGIR